MSKQSAIKYGLRYIEDGFYFSAEFPKNHVISRWSLSGIKAKAKRFEHSFQFDEWHGAVGRACHGIWVVRMEMDINDESFDECREEVYRDLMEWFDNFTEDDAYEMMRTTIVGLFVSARDYMTLHSTALFLRSVGVTMCPESVERFLEDLLNENKSLKQRLLQERLKR